MWRRLSQLKLNKNPVVRRHCNAILVADPLLPMSLSFKLIIADCDNTERLHQATYGIFGQLYRKTFCQQD